MTTLLENSKKLYYIGIHKRVFEVENLYPLDVFENFVEQIEKTSENCILESSCKIEQDKLYPARFDIGFKLQNLEQLNAVYNFFQKVEARADVRVNHSLIQQFFGEDFDFSKMTGFMVGVDVRRELAESKLKLALTIKDYPEKLKVAIALNGGLDETIQALMVSNSLHLGFDLSLNGGSNIELYLYIKKQEFQQIHIQQRLAKVLSTQALQPLPACSRICVGLSKANAEKVVYYYLENFNDFLNYFAANDTARRVHAYYREQPVKEMCVALQESELLAGTIQKMNLYYLI
ncbi:LynF/TruF/PatF family peptide O-prenyltransferase [Lyngbya sp. CCAP 1446/10]|uniref:LynF/TruF/PatF family peptide O-prenyltransferase n=1 Tax=Lyngbya sp. CCAP 1446/10 TaxID=439293 RepID=UPI0022389DA3|nr:LynF/TruF/PatF family peptide O-prenyltransferase [Lyngbya sp. CCAP 1446/10]MCW6049891.1 LynF/TruF/PatF family peptide O-prenyltransferase [Lyngbya sp. CCAP 1446/10]